MFLEMLSDWAKLSAIAYVVTWAGLVFGFGGMMVMAFWPEKKPYRVVEHEKTDWGVMFAIVSPKGEIVGLDRWKPARERCAALNRQPSSRNCLPTP